MNHLKKDVIDSYLGRELDDATLATIDGHLAGCFACATALSERASASASWERRGLLGRLVRVERRLLAMPVRPESEQETAAA
jgi:hypothetical protein